MFLLFIASVSRVLLLVYVFLRYVSLFCIFTFFTYLHVSLFILFLLLLSSSFSSSRWQALEGVRSAAEQALKTVDGALGSDPLEMSPPVQVCLVCCVLSSHSTVLSTQLHWYAQCPS